MIRTVPRGARDGWRTARAAGSLLALAGLVVGVPVVLITAGGVPFLHTALLPTGRSLTDPHAGDPQEAVRWIAGSAMVVAWAVWAWLAVCVLVELRSWATGRPPVRLPASRMAQSLVAFLVGTTLTFAAVGRGVSVPPQNRATVGAHPASASSPEASGAEDDIVPIAELLAAADGRPGPTPEARWEPTERLPSAGPAGPRDVVPPTGSSGPGRPTATVDGPGIDTRPDAADEGDPTPPPVADPLAVPRTHLVRSRETLWSIAEDELGSATRWRELAELNYGILQEDGGALDAGHWITPGWRLLLPPRDLPAVPAPTSPVVAPPERLPLSPPSVPAASPPLSATRGPSAPAPAPTPAPPLVPLGAGVVGAGVVRLIDRMRQVQQRHRPDGGLIRLPDATLRRFESRLRVGDGWEVTREVDEAVRLAAASAEEPTGTGQVLGVRIQSELIEVVLDPPGGPPVVVDRAVLVPTSSTRNDTSGADPRAIVPMLAVVGRSQSGTVMVNLEALGSLVVSGDPAAADGLVRALALELATSYWSGQFSVAVVGFGSELERFVGIRFHSDARDLVHMLDRRLRGAEMLLTTGYASFAHARSVDPSERWAPGVVICGPGLPDADVAELLEVASDPVHGSAVVAVGERVEGQHVLRLSGTDGTDSLELLGDVAFPQQVDAGELREVAALLETTASRQPALRSDEPYASLPVPLPTVPLTDTSVDHTVVPPTTGPRLDPGDSEVEVEVEVAVLGPVEIRGAARPFTRAWAEELVVYLAMHPNGASNEAWATALWPDRLMAPSSLHSTASVARRSLGQSTGGVDHLPRAHGRLALSATVGTDWDRFVALAESGRPEQWRAALTLVRGRPFDGLRSSDWPILEGIAPAIEAAVVDLSGRLAGACLGQGDATGAAWAARKGLVVSPYDERLYRMLMRAADAAGNPAGVDAVMSELLTLVADGIEPLDAVHPATMELYRTLSRRGTFS